MVVGFALKVAAVTETVGASVATIWTVGVTWTGVDALDFNTTAFGLAEVVVAAADVAVDQIVDATAFALGSQIFVRTRLDIIL